MNTLVQARQDHQAPQDLKDIHDPQDLKDIQYPQDLNVILEPQDHQDPQDLKDIQDPQAFQDPQVISYKVALYSGIGLSTDLKKRKGVVGTDYSPILTSICG